MPKHDYATRTRYNVASPRKPRRWAARSSFRVLVWRKGREFEVWFAPRQGFTCCTVRDRRPDGIVVLTRLRPPEIPVKKKIVGAAAGTSSALHLAPLDGVVLGKFPALVAHCAVTRYDDGEPRRPGWFTVKSMGSAWCIQVKDPDAAASMTAIGNTLDDALTLAELLLGAEEAPWEPDAFLKRLNGSSKKGS